ncbi:MAG: hypothetical protein J6Z49_10150 [Kiritimatiellae bacterium]|nr:hypothetical protein [Kiritimatiellia bacterium]
MERVAQMELHGNLACRKLRLELPQGGLILVGLQSKGQLPPQIGKNRLPPRRRLRIVDDLRFGGEHFPNQIGRLTVHANQQAADPMHFRSMAMCVFLKDLGSRENFDVVRDQLPSAQIEVANAKVGSFDTDV